MGKDIFFTPEGLDKIEKEIEYLKTVRRKEVVERIRVALGYRDLSENSEYNEARNEQAHVEERIIKLENIVKNTRVVEEGEIDKDTIGVGTHIKIRDKRFDEEDIFDIVGSAEADPLEGKVSNGNPAGAALIGCKTGNVAEVEVPDGVIHYEVVKVSP